MYKYIKKIQDKDEIIRKQILLSLMIVSVVFVGFIWIYNLNDSFNDKTQEQAKDDFRPFQMFADSVSNTYKNIKASVDNASFINSNGQDKLNNTNTTSSTDQLSSTAVDKVTTNQ